jgi:hypothetical protein
MKESIQAPICARPLVVHGECAVGNAATASDGFPTSVPRPQFWMRIATSPGAVPDCRIRLQTASATDTAVEFGLAPTNTNGTKVGSFAALPTAGAQSHTFGISACE